jgi:hypothetical protein
VTSSPPPPPQERHVLCKWPLTTDKVLYVTPTGYNDAFFDLSNGVEKKLDTDIFTQIKKYKILLIRKKSVKVNKSDDLDSSSLKTEGPSIKDVTKYSNSK